MNIQERILTLNREHTGNDIEIADVLLTIITKFQLFEPCLYLSEDTDWVNLALISLEKDDVSQAMAIKKSEIQAFGIFSPDEIEIVLPQVGSEDLYQ